MKRESGVSKFIKNIIGLIILLIIFYFAYTFLMQYYFGDFAKAVYKAGITQFVRDDEVKYSDIESFKIVSNDYNDAMLCKEIDVIPNTVYRISCMIKTDGVTSQKGGIEAGAQICISDTFETSKSIGGTSDWQKIEFMFDSKNREKVIIGFRLGGYSDACMGTAWFSDFILEQGARPDTSKWNFACFVFQNIDVNVNGKNAKVSMSSNNVNVIHQDMQRFKNVIADLSSGKMQVEYDTFDIVEPITSVTYDDVNGYYVAPSDVYKVLDRYLENKNYDHIFIAMKFGDKERGVEIPVNGWMGLGGMEYLGIGFSNIRLPSDKDNVVYEYYADYNTFPEEVFVHEFLHSLERDLNSYGYEFPELHDYEKYGYKEDKANGLKKWYRDYMNCEVYNQSTGKYVGLDKMIYKKQPIHSNSFEYTIPIDIGWKKDNLLDVIKNSLKILNQEINLKKENITIESFRI